MKRWHWITDAHAISRILRKRWRKAKDLALPATDALIEAERQLYERAADAYENGRRLFPLPAAK